MARASTGGLREGEIVEGDQGGHGRKSKLWSDVKMA